RSPRRVARDGAARPTRPARPLPGLRAGVTALDHAARDHAMELGAVVEPRVRELLEIGDGVRHLVSEQLSFDRALGRFEDRLLVRHSPSSWMGGLAPPRRRTLIVAIAVGRRALPRWRGGVRASCL